MNDIINQEFTQSKEKFSSTQEKALKLVIEKESQIQKAQEEIGKILQANNLNLLDIDKYKHDKNIDQFLNIKFPG